jgi:hypothetical protein
VEYKDKTVRNVQGAEQWVLVAAFFVVALFVQLFIIPQQMDEHGMMHLLACDSYPFHQMNTYIEPCTKLYDLEFAGRFHWRYSAPYTGSLLDWLYRPVFALWPHPYSYFLFTGFFWALCVLALSRFLQVPLFIAFIGFGMHFAVVYHLWHGASSLIPNLCMILIPLAASHAVRGEKPVRWGLLAALMLCAGIEAKIFFFYLIPIILTLSLFTMVAWRQFKQASSRGLRFLLAAGLPSAAFAATLLLSPSSNDPTITHAERILRHSKSFTTTEITRYWQKLTDDFVRNWFDLANVMNRIYQPMQFNEQNILGNTIFWTALFWVIAIFCIVWALALERRQRLLPYRLEILALGCVLASLIGVLLIGTNKRAWTHHHHFHAIVPIFYLFTASLGALWWRRGKIRQIIVPIALLLATVSLTSVLLKSMQPLDSGHEGAYNGANETEDYEKILAWLRQPKIGNNVIMTHVSWGMYYTSSLYGSENQFIIHQRAKFINDVPGTWRRLHQATQGIGRPYVFTVKDKRGLEQRVIESEFGKTYDITQNVLSSMPSKPAIRFLCEPPVAAMQLLCNAWKRSQRPAGWQVLSTVPYAHLIGEQREK